MPTHSDKIHERLIGTPIARDIEWGEFEVFWEGIADEVEHEKNDRLVVKLHGHREVFHRPRDGRVPIAEIERARRLLATPTLEVSTARLLVVTVDAHRSQIIDFDMTAKTVSVKHELPAPHLSSHNLRAAERRGVRTPDDVLLHDFDDIAIQLRLVAEERPFVVVGHGDSDSAIANGFVDRLRVKHPDLFANILAVVKTDLSAATDSDLKALALGAL